MLIISLIAVVGTLCGLVFTFAVYAVPAFAGLTAASFAYQTGAGALGAAVVGLTIAALTLGVFRLLFASTRSATLRRALALGFAGPAAFAGYHAALGVAGMGTEVAAWSQALGVIGGLVVGIVAWSRLTAYAPPSVPGGTSPATIAGS